MLFEVSERESFDPIGFDPEPVRDQLLAESTLTLLQAILERLREDVGVRYTQDFIDNFGLGDTDAAGA